MEIQEFKIPKEIMISSELGRKEKLLFAIILAHAVNNNGKCIIKNSEIGEILNIHPQAVNKSLKKLKNKNYISTTYKNRTPSSISRSIPSFVKEDPKYNIIRTIQVDSKFFTPKRRRRNTSN